MKFSQTNGLNKLTSGRVKHPPSAERSMTSVIFASRIMGEVRQMNSDIYALELANLNARKQIQEGVEVKEKNGS